MVKNSLRLFAHYYYSMGFNVTSISNEINDYNFFNASILKAPTHSWESFIKRRQTVDEMVCLDWESAKGIGCVLGYNNIRCLDFDDVEDLDLLPHIMESLGLPIDYEWLFYTGSKKGIHIYIKTAEHHFDIKSGQTSAFYSKEEYSDLFRVVELRWKYHCVLPPSIHKSYNYYSFNDLVPKNPPQRIDIEKINRFINKFCIHNQIVDPQSTSKVYFLNTDGSKIDNGSEYWTPNNMYSRARERRIIVFDTETNGLPINWNEAPSESNNWPRLIQIGWYVFGENANLVEKKAYNIRPDGFEISKEVSDLTSLTMQDLLNSGVDLNIAINDFINDLERTDCIVAHNLDFDKNIILSECLRLGKDTAIIEDAFNNAGVCTMKSTIDFCNLPQKKYPKITELYHILFREELPQTHEAISDAKYTAKCFWELYWREIITINNNKWMKDIF